MTTNKFFSMLLLLALVFTFTNCRNDDNDDPTPPPPSEKPPLNMVRIEGGTFHFGAGLQDGVYPDNEGGTAAGVATTVSTFFLSATPITQAQYHYVMRVNPSRFQVSNNVNYAHPHASARPIEGITWYHAIAFANKLSLMENREPVYHVEGISNADWRNITHADVPTIVDIITNVAWLNVAKNLNANGFRLPTEAEWEFAARGGIQSESAQGRGRDFFFSNGNNGNNVWHWQNHNTVARTHPVAHFAPNALGLYDMSGNVWEWTWNRSDPPPPPPAVLPAIPPAGAGGTNPVGPETGSYRVVRGGSFGNNAVLTRVSYRRPYPPAARGTVIGFRLASNSVQ